MADTLRDHIAVEHRQGAAAYEGDDESVATWHDQCEHRPGRTTHLDHAHDEVSARRFRVQQVAWSVSDA